MISTIRHSGSNTAPPEERYEGGGFGGSGFNENNNMNIPRQAGNPRSTNYQEPTDTSKQPIITHYLGHVTGYQPIRGPGTWGPANYLINDSIIGL